MKIFRPGMFYGDVARRRQVGAIALAELQPTVPEHDVETHSHDDAHFVLVLAGRYVSSAHGMPAVCASPALVYNPPGTVHRDCFRGLEGRFFTLSIPADALGDRALPTRAIRPGALSERHAFALRAALHGDDSAALDIETGLEVLLDSLQHRQRLECSDGPAWLARARDRLRDDCADPPRIDDLARLAGVHPVAFARTFRRRYGRSPGEYLRECRLERAAALLRDRRRPLMDVAALAGFSDQSHLSRAFRQHFGCTPSDYRRLR